MVVLQKSHLLILAHNQVLLLMIVSHLHTKLIMFFGMQQHLLAAQMFICNLGMLAQQRKQQMSIMVQDLDMIEAIHYLISDGQAKTKQFYTLHLEGLVNIHLEQLL